MSQNKLVSIAMTTYNGEKYLREQLDSIYNQTYKNIEVIVCDDCSTDDTVKILEEYKQKYGLKYFINEKNLGYVKNFEKAASLCVGEYIALCDQDDIWMPEKIEVLVKEIGDNHLIFSDAQVIDENNNLVHESRIKYLHKDVFNGNLSIKSVANNNVIGCVCLLNRDLLDKALPFPEGIGHDNWIMMIAAKLKSRKFLHQQLIKYRVHGENTSAIDFQKKLTLKKALLLPVKKLLGKLYYVVRNVYFYFKTMKYKKIMRQRGIR